MQIKNKKNIFDIIVLIAITFTFVSFFTPFGYLDYSDVLEKMGYENPDLYWRSEESILLSHLSEHDYRNPDNHQEFHRYTFFHLLKFEIGKPTGEFSSVTDYETLSDDNNNLPMSYSLFRMLRIIFSFLFFALFIYFSFRIIKNKTTKKNQYILYNIILIFIILTLLIASNFYINQFKDVNNLGYVDSTAFGYGFYLMIGSIVLFFIIYFMKRYFFELQEKLEVDKF